MLSFSDLDLLQTLSVFVLYIELENMYQFDIRIINAFHQKSSSYVYPYVYHINNCKEGEGGDVLLLINIVNHVSSQPQNCIYNPNTKQINNNNKVTNMSIQ